jgi:hypothetical protein
MDKWYSGGVDDAVPTWDQRILAEMPPGVDPTLVAESLRLTPTERLARLQKLVEFFEAVHRPATNAVPRNPRNAGQG